MIIHPSKNRKKLKDKLKEIIKIRKITWTDD